MILRTPRFSIRLAIGGAVATGMAFGMLAMLWMGAKESGFNPLMLGLGLFFGGAMALPLALSHLIAGIAARALFRGSRFTTQFAAFAFFTLGAYVALLQWLDEATRMIGGILHGDAAMLRQLLFLAASLLVAWLFMATARPSPAAA